MAHLRPLLIVLFLLTCSSAPADDKPVTLDELVKEYERFELPFPPAGTKCVLIEYGYDAEKPSEDGTFRFVRRFALLAKPRTRAVPEARYFTGVGTDTVPISARLREVPPEPESLRHVTGNIEYLDFISAIQCRKLGYNRLADEIYRRWKPFDTESPREHLLSEVQKYWVHEIRNPNRDRKTIIRHLKALNREDYSTQTAKYISGLELADAARRGNVDPLERLFDELADSSDAFRENSQNPYLDDPPIRKLIERGFDAIPAVISHLEDKRLTRSTLKYNFFGEVEEELTVTRACEILLNRLADETFPREELTQKEEEEREKAMENGFRFGNAWLARKPFQKAPIQTWWANARQAGEKEYLKSHVIHKHAEFGDVVNPALIAMMALRHPDELKDIYRKVLDSKQPIHTRLIADAIVKSSLDRNVKREVLELGLKHNDLNHRMDADAALAILDNSGYSKRLVTFIDKMPLPADDPEKEREWTIMESVNRSNDPAVWISLEKALRRSPIRFRFQTLWPDFEIERAGDPSRRERIRLLAAFLEDRSVRTTDQMDKDNPHRSLSGIDRYELRNYVAFWLAPYFAEYIDYDEHRSNDEWAFLRKWLKDEVAKELK